MKRLRRALLGVVLGGLATFAAVGWLAASALLMVEASDEAPADSVRDGLAYATPGSHPVGVRDLTTAGDRPVRAMVWYPAAPSDLERERLTYSYAMRLLGSSGSVTLATFEGRAVADAPQDRSAAPYPLVVLSPGFALTTTTYGWLAEHLASYGFVVVSPQHEETLDPSQLWRSTVTRPRDVDALVSHVADEPARSRGWLAGLVDPSRAAIVGHSYGGYTALAAAGARLDTSTLRAECGSLTSADDPRAFLCDALVPHVDDMAALAGLDAPPAGLWPPAASRRFDAAVSLAGDAVMFGRTGMAESDTPLMTIGGTADVDSPYDWSTRLAYAHSSSPRKVEVGLDGAAHFAFAGPCQETRLVMRVVRTGFCSDPAWDRDDARAVVAHLTTAFLESELMHDADATAALHSRPAVPDVTYQETGY